MFNFQEKCYVTLYLPLVRVCVHPSPYMFACTQLCIYICLHASTYVCMPLFALSIQVQSVCMCLCALAVTYGICAGMYYVCL